MKKFVAFILAALMSACCLTAYANSGGNGTIIISLPEETKTLKYTIAAGGSYESGVLFKKTKDNTNMKIVIEATDKDHDITLELLDTSKNNEISYSKKMTVLTEIETEFQIPSGKITEGNLYSIKITPQGDGGSGKFTVSGVALSESDKEEAYGASIRRKLTNMGVYTGFADEEAVTRGKAARAIATLASLSSKEGESVFSDVSGENAPYVNALKDAGIVGGCGGSAFEPDRAITYEEAITMLVRALGYEASAKNNGGYPSGYLKIAAGSIKITKGVSGRTGEALTGEKLIALMYNSLDVGKLVEVSGSDGASEWEMQEENTFRATLTKAK